MICPIILGSTDVGLLVAFIAGAEEQNDFVSILSEIDSITRSEIVLQLENAVTDGLAITEQPGLNPRDSRIDSRLRRTIL
jgi:xanthine dehydrogenase iron-sulfur cluster and FAD-binding subunit A